MLLYDPLYPPFLVTPPTFQLGSATPRSQQASIEATLTQTTLFYSPFHFPPTNNLLNTSTCSCSGVRWTYIVSLHRHTLTGSLPTRLLSATLLRLAPPWPLFPAPRSFVLCFFFFLSLCYCRLLLLFRLVNLYPSPYLERFTLMMLLPIQSFVPLPRPLPFLLLLATHQCLGSLLWQRSGPDPDQLS